MNSPDEVISYFKSLSPKDSTALGALRELIHRLVPNAEERLSRGVPFFYYRGKRAVGFRSSKYHLSFFIMEGKVMDNLRNEMAGLDNSSTVIRFTADKPIPEKLIEKLVLARVQEIDQALSRHHNHDTGKTSTTTQ